ncbi:helicase-related protein [Chloroflexota bacterium]
MNINSGSIIQGPRWPEPIKIDLIEELGEYIHIVGAHVNSGTHVDQVLTKLDLEEIESGEIKAQFTADPRHFFLALEAHRYRFASLYDPLLAMNISKVDPLPHQIEAVYGRILKYPRIRFLIADDPGAGKTIMAGLIIKELKLRHLAKRILIVSPGHLKDQWRREMKDRFEEIFTVVDRSFMGAFYGQNVWARESQLITSIDFAKQDDILVGLSSVNYDLIIVDEAHKMAAYRYGEKLNKTGRYRLGERLSEVCTHLLFLTATPHRGDPENFRLFLDLLEPGFFATTEMVAESIKKQENPLFIRRLKEDMKDFEGRDIFLPRHVKTKPFNLGVESYSEKELYNDLSRYVKEQYNKALSKDKRRNVAFALVILQRRLASSTYALLRSLERRKKRMEDLLRGAEQKKNNDYEYDIEELDDLSEEERWEKEEIWETLSVAESRHEFEEELRTLDNLIQQANVIINSDPPIEAKLRHFKSALEELEKMQPDSKILIFTESRDTLDYLQKNLERWNYKVCTIHGGMKLEERINNEAVFKNEAQLLVATEAAGEGINLQFCNLMINYDIPWNPNRLEQRMGRIHRYGQTREVFIFNLVAADTREGQVLKALFDKLEEIRDALGSDKVFDVLGDIIQGRDLGQIMVEAAAGARSMDEILKEIEIKVDPEYISRIHIQLGDSLASHFIDYTRIHDMADQAREHRLIPEYTEAYFKRAMEILDGKWQPKKIPDYPQGSFLSVSSIPTELKYIADEEGFRKQFGTLLRRYPLATFDKDASMRVAQAELITFGDPLFEAMLTWVERILFPSLKEGAVFTDPDGIMDGTLLFYQGEIRDGKNEIAGTRLFALFAGENRGTIKPVNPAILWDLQEGGQTGEESQPLETLQKSALSMLLPELETYRQELLSERQRQAAIKEKYGLKSLEMLDLKLDGDLINLYTRRDKGDKVDLAIYNKEEQKKQYKNAASDLRNSLERERNLTLSTPRFLGVAKIIPASGVDKMVSDVDVERIGMQVTMDYERTQGRKPEDVAKENLGFDVRSIGKNNQRRYIEVKGRAGSGSVSLTQNEWFKAKRFGGEFYLYVVLNTSKQPELYCIQDPAASITPDEQIEVRYIVSLNKIKKTGITPT